MQTRSHGLIPAVNRDFDRHDMAPIRGELREADPVPAWVEITAETAGAVVATIALFTAFAWLVQRSRRRPLDPSHPAFG